MQSKTLPKSWHMKEWIAIKSSENYIYIFCYKWAKKN